MIRIPQVKEKLTSAFKWKQVRENDWNVIILIMENN